MATYTVTTAKHATLTANTVDTVTVTTARAHADAVEVLHRGAAQPIYFTTDGSTPTVGGDDTLIVLPGGGVRVDTRQKPITVKVISAEAAPYSVIGA